MIGEVGSDPGGGRRPPAAVGPILSRAASRTRRQKGGSYLFVSPTDPQMGVSQMISTKDPLRLG